jgi:tape measure domain-containing protein
MAGTEVSIKIIDRIGNKIAPKLAAIGTSAAAAAPGIDAFRVAWGQMNFAGMQGIGLGSVSAQLKQTEMMTNKLRISMERLKQAQLRTAASQVSYGASLNRLRIQEKKMIADGMGAEARANAQAAAQIRYAQSINVTAVATSTLSNKEIKRAILVSELHLKNQQLAISQNAVSESALNLQIKQNSLAQSAFALSTADNRLSTSTVGVASATTILNGQLNRNSVLEKKLIKDGLGLEVVNNKIAASQASVSKSLNVTSKLTSNLSKKEIKRQSDLIRLDTLQNKNKKSLIELATANAKLTNQLNRNSAANSKHAATTAAATAQTKKFALSLREMNGRLLASRGMMGGLVSNLRSYLSLGALIGAGAFLKGADSFKTIQNQLRGVTTSSEQLKDVTQGLFGIALRARVPISSLAISYRRYDMALRRAGESQASTLRITETISKLLTLNGSSAMEASQSLLQLSQAFNKGKLDGDEFRTTAEVMPQLVDNIAKSLGIARGEIYKFSKDGKITIGILLKALKGMEEKVDELMKNTEFTVGQAFTNLVTKVIFAFGQWDRATGFTKNLAKLIGYIGDNLDTVLRVLESITAFVIVGGIASLTAAFASFVVATGGLGLLAPILAGIAATMTFLSGEIIVSVDGMVTLRDVIYYGFKQISSTFALARKKVETFQAALLLVANQPGFTWLKFLAEPQRIFDGMLRVLIYIRDALITVVALTKSLWDAFKPADFVLEPGANWTEFGVNELKDKLDLFKQFFMLVFQEMAIFALRILARIADAFSPYIESFVNGAIRKINELSESINSFLSYIPSTKKIKMIPEVKLDFPDFPNYYSDKLDEGSDSFGKTSIIENVRKGTEELRKIFEEARKNGTEGASEWINSIDAWSAEFIKQIVKFKEATGEAIDASDDAITKLKNLRGPGPNTLGEGALNGLKDQAVETESVFKSVFSNMSNAFQNFVRTGKLDFKELMRSILADLLKMFMNKLFQQLFSGMMGGGGGLFGGLMGFAGGGAVPSGGSSVSLSSGFGSDNFGSGLPTVGGGFFADGGYTGGKARNGIAGFVHGQEYVMPASQTAKYRSTLDAMRNGTLKTGSTAGGGVMVNVNNYTDSNVSVERNKNGELELTIREIARQQIAEQTPKLISANLRNANSRESKALGQSTYTRRKR